VYACGTVADLDLLASYLLTATMAGSLDVGRVVNTIRPELVAAQASGDSVARVASRRATPMPSRPGWTKTPDAWRTRVTRR